MEDYNKKSIEIDNENRKIKTQHIKGKIIRG